MEFNCGRGGSGDAQPPRCSDVAVFDDVQCSWRRSGSESPITEDQQLRAAEDAHQPNNGYRRRQARDRQTLGDALVEHRAIVTAGLVRGARKTRPSSAVARVRKGALLAKPQRPEAILATEAGTLPPGGPGALTR